MNVSFQIATYLAILRKHVLLLVISAALVIAAGFAYLNQQVPVYQSAAKLLITVPERSAMGPKEIQLPFNISRQKLNTEIHLLRDNVGMASEVVRRLKEEGIDTDAHGYSEGELRAGVQVDFITGTELVRFSLTGPVPATLPQAVNVYAAVYKEQTEEKSAASYLSQVAALDSRVRKAEGGLDEAEGLLSTFLDEHAEFDFRSRVNPHSKQADKLAQMLPDLEDQNLQSNQDRALLEGTLKGLGIGIARTDAGYTLVDASEGAAPIGDRLVESEVIVGLSFVAGNAEVRRLVEEESSAAHRDRRLEQEGDLVDSRRRKATREDIRLAREKRGRMIQQLLRRHLAECDDLAARLEDTRSRHEAKRHEEKEMNRLLTRYDRLFEEKTRTERILEQANAEYQRYTSILLQTESDEASNKPPTLLVEIRTPATGAVQIAPNNKVILGLTFFAAGAIGLGLVLLIEYLDDTIKSKEDFDRYVGLPFLGFVPHIGDDEPGNRDLAADAKPGSPIAESFRTIRTSILFSRSDKNVQTILVTSAGPGEGKTTVASNLAATLAKHKGPVLLIDADLRRPRVAKALGIPNTQGLTNCLIGEAKVEDIAVEMSVEGLHVLPSGPIPPNPAELLHGEAMARLLEEVRGKYDRIVIDSPPVIAVTDARVLASQVDGLYVVISMGKTSRRLIQRALESITSIGFQVHGAILNNLSAPTGRYGYYYYRDYAYGKGYYKYAEPKAEKPA